MGGGCPASPGALPPKNLSLKNSLRPCPAVVPGLFTVHPRQAGPGRRGRTKSGNYKGQASSVPSVSAQRTRSRAPNTALLRDAADAADALMASRASVRRCLISGPGAPPGLSKTLRHARQSECLQIPGTAKTLRRFADQTSSNPYLGRLGP